MQGAVSREVCFPSSFDCLFLVWETRRIKKKRMSAASFNSKFCIPRKAPGYLEEFVEGYLHDTKRAITDSQVAWWKALVAAEWEGYTETSKPRKPRTAAKSTAASGAATPMDEDAPVPAAVAPPPASNAVAKRLLQQAIAAKVGDSTVRDELLAYVALLG